MVGLVVCAHGRLAEELVRTAEEIVGRLDRVATCSVHPGDGPDSIRKRMKEALAQADTGEGVLVLADMFGGTPCNESLGQARDFQLEVVTGVNLPILLKANLLRRDPLPLRALATELVAYGQKNISCATALVGDLGPAKK